MSKNNKISLPRVGCGDVVSWIFTAGLVTTGIGWIVKKGCTIVSDIRVSKIESELAAERRILFAKERMERKANKRRS